ncbi:MAG: ACT domain-containing protein [Clostridia bacterium]|nr:ACT domain-containing protein [Clostridia bacterium]
MAIKQLSIFVENKSGALADITGILAENSVDLRALSIAETQDFGILRLIVNDTEKAAKVLRNKNCVVNITEICAVAVPDTPGGLASVLRILADANIVVEYTYAFISNSKKDAYVVLRINDHDLATAEKLFREKGICEINESDIQSL